MKKASGYTVLAVLMTLLAACIQTQSNPREVSLEDAARANLQLGASYLQRGQLERAREKLEKAVSQDPKLASARTYLAVLYERLRGLPRIPRVPHGGRSHVRRPPRTTELTRPPPGR